MKVDITLTVEITEQVEARDFNHAQEIIEDRLKAGGFEQAQVVGRFASADSDSDA